MQYLSELGQNILTAARNFTFKDAIDVAIVTVLLYSAIKLVRETRAGQLVKGIILLIVLFWIWRSGQKITTNCDNAKFFSMRQFRMAHSKLQCRDFR